MRDPAPPASAWTAPSRTRNTNAEAGVSAAAAVGTAARCTAGRGVLASRSPNPRAVVRRPARAAGFPARVTPVTWEAGRRERRIARRRRT